MTRSALALTLVVAFAGFAFGARTVTQMRRYGDSGWRFSRPDNRVAALTHGMLALSAVLLVVAPVVAVAAGSAHAPAGWSALTGSEVGRVSATIGAVLALAGAAVTLVAQRQMGASWRIGVDPTERTALITGGLFRYVRNPIFTGIGIFAVGQALLVPNLVMLGALILGCAGLQGQVRYVEEPYLANTHGAPYRDWAAPRGRFLPGMGKALSLGAGSHALSNR